MKAFSRFLRRWRNAAAIMLPGLLTGDPAAAATTAPQQLAEVVTPLGDFGYGGEVGIGGDYAVVGNRLRSRDTGTDFRTVDILVRNSVDGRWDRWKSLASPGGRLAYFGWSVAMDGDLAVVGAPEFLDADSEGANVGAGAVFVYGRNQGGTNNWGLVRALTGFGPTFGSRVRISGDTLIVGEPRFLDEGRIHIHSRNQGGVNLWGRVKSLAPAVPGGFVAKGIGRYRFGTVFDVSTGRLVIGGYDDYEPFVAAVNIYQKNTGGVNNWGVERTIAPPAGNAGDFGWQVALEGTRLAIGQSAVGQQRIHLHSGSTFSLLTTLEVPGMEAFGPADIGGDMLAVRMMEPSGKVWVSAYRWPEAGGFTLRATRWTGYGETRLSEGLAVNSDSVLLGVDDPASQAAATGAGCLRAVERTSGGADAWGLWATPAKPDISGGGGFGKSMAMKKTLFFGDLLVVGNPDFPAGGTARGMVSVFSRRGDRWELACRLSPVPGTGPGPVDNARFGEAVAVDSLGNILVGAPGENASDGAAYRYEPVPQSLSHQQEGLQYSQTDRFTYGGGSGGKFGASVAMDTWVMFVGQPEGGIGGAGNVVQWVRVAGGWGFNTIGRTDPDGNTANDSFGTALALEDTSLVATAMGDENNGAAYFFEYNTTTQIWDQRQKIVPTDTTTGFFGKSAALRDNRLVIGVFPYALILIGPGNAFYFTRGSGTNWTQRAFLRPAGLENGDAHGFSAALGEDFAVVGVPGDDGATNGQPNSGAACLYDAVPGGTTVLLTDQIRPAVAGEEFGAGVAADWVHFAISSPRSDVLGTDCGLVRIYRLGSYERWACSKGLASGNNGPKADADGDGQPNMVEFAFNTNPRLNSSRGNLVFGMTTGGDGLKHLLAIYVKPGSFYSTAGLRASLEGGYTLNSVQFGTVDVTQDDSSLLVGHLAESATTKPKGFLRLKVEYPIR